MDSYNQLMSSQEYQKFKNYFEDKKQAKELISFSDFSNIVKNSSSFDQSRVGPFLESIKKELKTNNRKPILIHTSSKNVLVH